MVPADPSSAAFPLVALLTVRQGSDPVHPAATGAALGAVTLADASPAALGWVGAACVIASLLLMIATTRRARTLSPVAC